MGFFRYATLSLFVFSTDSHEIPAPNFLPLPLSHTNPYQKFQLSSLLSSPTLSLLLYSPLFLSPFKYPLIHPVHPKTTETTFLPPQGSDRKTWNMIIPSFLIEEWNRYILPPFQFQGSQSRISSFANSNPPKKKGRCSAFMRFLRSTASGSQLGLDGTPNPPSKNTYHLCLQYTPHTHTHIHKPLSASMISSPHH